MTDTAYNGWTNYETWLVNLWLGEEDYEGNLSSADKRQSAYDLGKRIRDYVEEMQPEVTGLYADMINAAIRAVNWQEIAEHMIEEDSEEDAA